MKIGIFRIASTLHNAEEIQKESSAFLNQIKNVGGFLFVDEGNHFENYDNYDLSLIFLETGGVENQFLKFYEKLHGPYYLLTKGTHNSFAASLEVLTFLKEQKEEAEILHGSVSYIAKRIQELALPKMETPMRLGVIGKPSDWLISCHVDREYALSRLKMEIIDIPFEEFLKEIEKHQEVTPTIELKSYPKNEASLHQGLEIYGALKRLVQKYNLAGLTVRCFDLLNKVYHTSCLAFAILNSEGIVATCEGDIPALVTMAFLQRELGVSSFQVNPSYINLEDKEMTFAHCTIPLNMTKNYSYDTHFESGLGIGISADIDATPITIFKIGNSLNEYFLKETSLKRTTHFNNLCRTQIVVDLMDMDDYFLNHSLGNHHVVILGKQQKKIEESLKKYHF